MTLPELRCEFVLKGDRLDPDVVSRKLGLEPSQTWRVGDPIVNNLGRRRSNAWIVTVGPERALGLQALATRLVEIMRPASGVLVQLALELEIVPSIYAPVYFYDQLPDLTFPPDAVKWGAEVGAELSVDLFDLREAAED